MSAGSTRLCKTFEILLQHLFQSLTTSDECHQHEHTPEHTEACQKRTRLISRQRIEDFSV